MTAPALRIANPGPMRFSAGRIVGYAVGSLGTGIFSTVPSVLLLYYCTEVARISPRSAALVLLLPKIWGILWDPYVGAWSDRTTSRFGQRRPFLAVGAIGVSLAFAAVFTTPAFTGEHERALWIGVAYFLLSSAYSVFAVPYIAIPGDICGDENERVRLVGARMTVAMLGVLIGAGLSPFLVSIGGGGQPGYRFMSINLALFCVVTMLIPVTVLRLLDTAPPRERTVAPRLVETLRAAIAVRSFRQLALAYFLMLTGVGALSSIAPYLVIKVLRHADADLGILLGTMLIVTIVSVPLWSRGGRRLGENRALVLGVALYAALTVGTGLTLAVYPKWLVAVVAFGLIGIPFAAAQVLPFTLLANLIHAQKGAGTNSAGTFTGAWTATEKLALAAGPAVTAIALSTGIAIGSLAPIYFAAIPALFMLLSLAPLTAKAPAGVAPL